MAVTEVVTRKVGPLPAWGWVAVIAGGYVAYRIIAGRSSGPQIGADVAPGTFVSTPIVGGGSSGGGDVVVPPLTIPPVTIPPTVTPPPSTSGGSGISYPAYTGPRAGDSLFKRTFGATPTQLYDATVAKIQAAGKWPIGNNLGTTDQAIALFRQYGGEAAAAALGTMMGLPTPTLKYNDPTGLGPTIQSKASTAYANQYFTGVVGTTTGQGIVYQAYRDGQLLGETYGGGDFDTSAWGESLGLNAWDWYSGTGASSGAPPAITPLPVVNTPTVPAPNVSVPNPKPPTYTRAQLLAAIAARSPGATPAQVSKTLANDLAKGYTPAQIIRGPRK